MIKHMARSALRSACFLRACLARPQLEGPPVVVLGYPRSGTTWIASVLSASGDGLYLHEPLTQHYHRAGTEPTLAPLKGQAGLNAMEAMRHIRNGEFWLLPPTTTRRPWRWLAANGRRLVVKEVNLYAADFMIRELFDSKVVFVVRHPAAIYASMKALGWVEMREFRVGDGSLARQHGRRQAGAIGAALKKVRARHRHLTIVRHEDVCRSPFEQFHDLCLGTSLPFDAAVKHEIARTTRPPRPHERGPWSIVRDSTGMSERWRRMVSDREREDLMQGWRDVGRGELLRFVAIGHETALQEAMQ